MTSAADIVERLRELALDEGDPDAREEDVLMREAADEVERLRRTVKGRAVIAR